MVGKQLNRNCQMLRENSNRIAAAILTAALFVVPVGAQSQIAGTWRGNSECSLKNSACHDETNVYRFSEIPARPDWFSGAGSKIVDGKEISMGTLDWHYNAAGNTLESDNTNAVLRLVVAGDKMEGTLLLPDGTVYRRIHLTKSK
jgi:hypothetical protein